MLKGRIARTLAGAALAAVVAGTAGYVVAQEPDAPTVIRERQELMKSFGAAMKTIGGYVQGGMGTAEEVAAAAGVIAQGAANLGDHFPPGTGMDDVTDPPTGAKMVIWEQWDHFLEEASEAEELAAAIQTAAATTDAAGLAPMFDELGNEGCGGCHQTFRQKLD